MIQLHANATPGIADETPGEYRVNGHGNLPSGRAGKTEEVNDRGGGDTAPSLPFEPSGPQGVVESYGQDGVQLLITHAVSGWIAVVMERSAYAVNITPLGGGNYEIEATLVDADGALAGADADVVYLRVSCALGAGKMVRTEVEPLARRAPKIS
jgi:hypothetical protein